MVKVLVFMGTRPEAIKLAPLVKEICLQKEKISMKVCVTGQHGDMLYQVLNDFSIVPDFDLKVMSPNQSLATLTSKLFSKIEKTIKDETPDWVIVQGDTTTAMVASICAYYEKTNVAHLEAGLRSHDFWTPFPEELNRKIISLTTKKHFSPTEIAKQNLISEKIKEDSIFMTGNTVIDALLWMVEKVRKNKPPIPEKIFEIIEGESKFVLVTGHRRESFGKGFREICLAIRDLSLIHKDIKFVYPVHRNPNVQEPVNEILGDLPGVVLSDPLDYKSFIYVMDNCVAVLTDSGGVQEEAPSLGKPVLVMRNITERMEGVNAGTSFLVGTDRTRIVEGVNSILKKIKEKEFIMPDINPYGDGLASKRIVEELIK